MCIIKKKAEKKNQTRYEQGGFMSLLSLVIPLYLFPFSFFPLSPLSFFVFFEEERTQRWSEKLTEPDWNYNTAQKDVREDGREFGLFAESQKITQEIGLPKNGPRWCDVRCFASDAVSEDQRSVRSVVILYGGQPITYHIAEPKPLSFLATSPPPLDTKARFSRRRSGERSEKLG
jgi:hypothetical protein